MNTGPNRILDEFVKVLTDAGGAAQALRTEADVFFRTQCDKALQKLDLVNREEFEVLKEMVLKVQAENKLLIKRVETLEKKFIDKDKI